MLYDARYGGISTRANGLISSSTGFGCERCRFRKRPRRRCGADVLERVTAAANLHEQTMRTYRQAHPGASRDEVLAERLGVTAEERELLWLAVAISCDPRLLPHAQVLGGNDVKRGVTLSLFATIMGQTAERSRSLALSLGSGNALLRFRLLEVTDEAVVPSARVLTAASRLAHYFSGVMRLMSCSGMPVRSSSRPRDSSSIRRRPRRCGISNRKWCRRCRAFCCSKGKRDRGGAAQWRRFCARAESRRCRSMCDAFRPRSSSGCFRRWYASVCCAMRFRSWSASRISWGKMRTAQQFAFDRAPHRSSAGTGGRAFQRHGTNVSDGAAGHAIALADSSDNAHAAHCGKIISALRAKSVDENLDGVALSYRLGAGGIRAAAQSASEYAATRSPGGELALHDIVQGVRTNIAERLGELAERIEVKQTWDDLVLAPDTMDQVRTDHRACAACASSFRKVGLSPKDAAGHGRRGAFFRRAGHW